MAYGVFGIASNTPVATAGSGFTRIDEQPSGESTTGDLFAEWAVNDNTIDATWSNKSAGALGVEIKAAGSGGGGVSAAQSTVAASPTSIVAGSGSSTITVTAKDSSGTRVSGATVVLSATGSGNTLTQPSGPTNAQGVATGTLSPFPASGRLSTLLRRASTSAWVALLLSRSFRTAGTELAKYALLYGGRAMHKYQDALYRASILSSVLLVVCGCNRKQVPSAAWPMARVPDVPPDSIPMLAWKAMYAPENIEQPGPDWPRPFPRNIVVVLFQEGTSRAEKQRTVDAIRGVVVGGAPIGKGGFYYVRIRDDGTSRTLFRAIETLKSFPQVETAGPVLPPSDPVQENPRRSDTIWPVLTSIPDLDTSRVVQLQDTFLVFRTDINLRFKAGISDSTKRAFFSRHAMSVVGVTQSGMFYVRIPDPGPLAQDLWDALDALRIEPEIEIVSFIPWTSMPEIHY